VLQYKQINLLLGLNKTGYNQIQGLCIVVFLNEKYKVYVFIKGRLIDATYCLNCFEIKKVGSCKNRKKQGTSKFAKISKL
jgi:hypothetical protein